MAGYTVAKNICRIFPGKPVPAPQELEGSVCPEMAPMDREFPTEEELLNGKCADGTRPKLHSREMYKGATKLDSKDPAEPPVADAPQSEYEKNAARMHFEADMQHLANLDLVETFARELVQSGLEAVREDRRGAGAVPVAVQPEASTPAEASTSRAGRQPAPLDASTLATPAQAEALKELGIDTSVNLPAEPYSRFYENGGIGCDPLKLPGIPGKPAKPAAEPSAEASAEAEAEAAGEAAHPSTKGGHRRDHSTRRGQGAEATDKPLSRAQRVAMAERGSKILVTVSAARAEVAHKLIDQATKLDVRKEFMEDRAVAVVNGLLLHLDEEWQELGFGAWMPFRWPDQWLSFCGVLRRVLAANGLIHARYADTYRKLLDETPPVELDGHVKERTQETRTPHNVAQCKWNQGAYTMSELKTRLQKERWDPDNKRRKEYEDYWEKQHGIKPPP
jgi:hypothetical protein